MPCQAPDVACLNQNNLVNFFLRAHHSVDVKTKPCKALWSPQMAAEAYTYQTDFCATCIVWGTTPLCKAVGETDCSAVNTTQPCGAVAPYLGPTPAPVTSSPTSSPQLMVECGVTLQPSISDWPVGKCGGFKTEMRMGNCIISISLFVITLLLTVDFRYDLIFPFLLI